MNSLHGGYGRNEAGYFTDGEDFAKGYHSVRVMGREGPNFEENWVDNESKAIWPSGDITQYEAPFYSYKNTECHNNTELCEEDSKTSKKKKAPKKKPAKKKKKTYNSDDEEMDSDDYDNEEGSDCDDNLA